MDTGSVPGVRRPGLGVDHLPQSSVAVELYLYSPSGSSWTVLRLTLPLLYFKLLYFTLLYFTLLYLGQVAVAQVVEVLRYRRIRFPIRSLVFFSDIILLAALWPWGRLSL